MTDAGSRDYEDVGEAARELGAEPPAEPRVRPVEERERTAAAVDDDAPAPDLVPPEPDGEPDIFHEPGDAGAPGVGPEA
ncbi:hypothetical protein [Phytohabitans suffuscus]|uniref:Uncharacterized protein n=1 Tax=Phytohabitans suffuscus TaxID=624315 RepID=A0A6F8YVK2_9ACTN|nr:hypothetical protein [Phytohabitans suffuscus]BCB90190.1 hypothetical protein Psuf_075030 [Phytohabitans suffuscus]